MASVDIHTQITDKIIAQLDSCSTLAECPWYATACIAAPVNVKSGKHYNGINVLALWASAQESEFTQGTWGTFKQW